MTVCAPNIVMQVLLSLPLSMPMHDLAVFSLLFFCHMRVEMEHLACYLPFFMPCEYWSAANQHVYE